MALKSFRLHNTVKGQISQVYVEKYFEEQNNVDGYERMVDYNVMSFKVT